MTKLRSTPDGGQVQHMTVGSTSGADEPMEDAMASNRGRTRRRCQGDGGAALVEFAIVAPLLFLLIFGVIEFGWAFFQSMDVRHGAREGVRLAAVNSNPSNSGSTQQERIALEACDRMDLDGVVEIVIDVDGSIVSPNTSNDVGDEVTFRVRKDLDTLTGFFDPVLGGITLDSQVTTRLEQSATYADLPAGSFTC